jgi:aconitate hydratase
MKLDLFRSKGTLKTPYKDYVYYRLEHLEKEGLTNLDRLPFSIRIMLESLLRQCNDRTITQADVINLAGWQPNESKRSSLPFQPARVLMQDFTGVPAVVDLAAMRSAMSRLGGNPRLINPLVPVDLVIDHSVQVDFFASPDALQRNAEMEFARNRERYEFLKWGQSTLDSFQVVPPATGIVHQVNLEYLAQVVLAKKVNGEWVAFPDTLVGTDSHTTMINGLGVVGWGVGGIEAEAAMLGQPFDMLIPEVVGFKIFGKLRAGVTATDLTLTVVQMLRQKGVVSKFVEFYGPGLDAMTLPDRATIANMSPEYGATIGYFPVDEETLRYLRLTGRSEEVVARVERYCKEQGLFRTSTTPDPQFSDTLQLDLETVEPSLAGPKRPQDRVALSEMKDNFWLSLSRSRTEQGFELSESDLQRTGIMGTNGGQIELRHGAVVIAAITSCTNTSNPSVMVGAGILAKKAVERGLTVKPYVKTSLAPGSRVVTEYLREAQLIEPLSSLGFNLVGYGCTTCIGNSGPLPAEVVKTINNADLVAAAVLSGNRNFEGRIHPYVRANYLASPPLVVAYALAGTVDIDLVNEPLGMDRHGDPVFLREIWPSSEEIQETILQFVRADMFTERYQDVFSGNETWNAIQVGEGELYQWQPQSTYIQEPPFFIDISRELLPIEDIRGARVLVMLGDSITTDHISPAGAIPVDSPAGKYLVDRGIAVRDFNSYGSRRGNHEVMIRGTFANIRLKNLLTPGVEGGYTLYMQPNVDDYEQMTIYEAARKYFRDEVPLVVLAGKEYGSGSSRDWAAKGTALLGVKTVIAESYERIHRSNLVGMGVLPLQFMPGENMGTLGLSGHEVYNITGMTDHIQPQDELLVTVERKDGKTETFKVLARLDTPIEVEYYLNGGILHTVLRKLL